MDIVKKYTYDYCWDTAHMMDALIEYDSLFWHNLESSVMSDRDKYVAGLALSGCSKRQAMIQAMIDYESVVIPKTIITMSKEEFNNSTFFNP